MLIGIQLSDLSRRSRWLLLVATLAFAAGVALYLLAPEPGVRLLRVWLGAVLALGVYWLSFLLDLRERLTRAQTIVASLFALLPWVLVILIVLVFPQILLSAAQR